MYQTEVIRRVAKETRLSQRVVADVLSASQHLMSDALREGQSVTFPGFGTFYTRRRPAVTVRHVRTQEPIEVHARQVAAFRVGEVLKRAVRRGSRKKRT